MRIGIDIGGMSVKIGLVEGQSIAAKSVIKIDRGRQTAYDLIEHVSNTVTALLYENGVKPGACEGIGIACPGTVDDQRGIVVYSNNLGWENVAILETMRARMAVTTPMALANDADAAALGEVLYGAAKGKGSAVLLTLGTGVGSGVIMNRKIFSGFLRGGCEVGHMAIARNGRLCTCGRRGCLEMYASATVLMEHARALAADNPQSLLCVLSGGKLSDIDGKVIFEARRRNDASAELVVDEYLENLSIGIANIVNIFRPEIVILGGGVSAQKEYLTDELQRRVAGKCFGGTHGQTPPIVTAELGNDAGIIGAAYLI
ncbi:MAG: ROK family protein [Lachnospiraceae bacterium]|nr:ROK family protein [Lachnospiraceae bacterium]